MNDSSPSFPTISELEEWIILDANGIDLERYQARFFPNPRRSQIAARKAAKSLNQPHSIRDKRRRRTPSLQV